MILIGNANLRCFCPQITSLLLLALKQPPEALAQFEAHVRLFRRLPFEGLPGLLASHHAWLCRCAVCLLIWARLLLLVVVLLARCASVTDLDTSARLCVAHIKSNGSSCRRQHMVMAELLMSCGADLAQLKVSQAIHYLLPIECRF